MIKQERYSLLKISAVVVVNVKFLNWYHFAQLADEQDVCNWVVFKVGIV